MPSFKNTTITKQKPNEIRKLTAIALSLLLGMVAVTQWVNFDAIASSGTGLNAIYFDNIDFTKPVLNRSDDVVNFDWDYNSPDGSIQNDSYSIRWLGAVEPRYSDTYNFYTFSDDGVRLWVDNKLIIDNWTDHPRTENIGYINLEAGKKYEIKLEYFENAGRAVMQLSWSSRQQPKEIIPKSQLYSSLSATAASSTTNNIVTTAPKVLSSNTGSLKGEYFDSMNFTNLKLTRNDPQINFNWTDKAPVTQVSHDSNSIRWTGKITPPSTGAYTFYTLSDDGVRLWIDNKLIIDNWSDHPATENSGGINLTGDTSYSVKLDYYERYGSSTISLSWSGPDLGKQIIGSNYFKAAETVNTVPVAPAPTTPIPSAPTSSPSPTPSTPTPQPSNPTSLPDTQFYSDSYSQAKRWVDNNRNSRPYEASLVEKIAQQPTAQWLGGWNWNLYEDVKKTATNATNSGKTAIFVAYNIPQRDCGSYSAGGVGSYEAYASWIGTIAAAIGNNKSLVVLEPDSLSLMDCLSNTDKENRMRALKDAVSILKKNSNTSVYIDAGHPGWVSVDTIANRLQKSGIDMANGFALNTSNFITTSDNINYGKQISSKVGNKKFVVDTSRNGNGSTPDYQWCNPWGRKLGNKPTTNTGNDAVDAYIWIKAPGESDGNCNGGPNAGNFWPEYAVDLVKNSGW